jgi:hypothetical protein
MLDRVNDVIQFPVPELNTPPRSPWMLGHTMLMSMFEDAAGLAPFIRHLYRTHGVLTVGQWDEAGGDLFEGFPLDDARKRHFLQTVGAPQRPRTFNAAKILELQARR